MLRQGSACARGRGVCQNMLRAMVNVTCSDCSHPYLRYEKCEISQENHRWTAVGGMSPKPRNLCWFQFRIVLHRKKKKRSVTLQEKRTQRQSTNSSSHQRRLTNHRTWVCPRSGHFGVPLWQDTTMPQKKNGWLICPDSKIVALRAHCAQATPSVGWGAGWAVQVQGGSNFAPKCRSFHARAFHS